MRALKKNLFIFYRMSVTNIRAMLEYKWDFLLTFTSGLFVQTVGLVFLFVLFGSIPSIAGWTLNEVALLYALSYVGEGMLTFLFQGTTGLGYYIRTGTFDRFMLRPLPVSVQVFSEKTNLAGVGTAATGVAIMIYAFGGIDAQVGAGAVALLILNMIFGVVIRVNLNYAANAFSFWLKTAGGTTTMIYNTQELGKYPITIYPKWVRVVLLTILPHAAVTYIPICLLLGKLPVMPYALITPACAAFMIVLRRLVMSRALLRYESAGN